MTLEIKNCNEQFVSERINYGVTVEQARDKKNTTLTLSAAFVDMFEPLLDAKANIEH